jgi:hypothetical protein
MPLSLQVSISEATMAQFSAPSSWPAKSAFLRVSEEAFQGFPMGRGFLAAHGAAFFGAFAPDGLFDPVERGNAHECLRGNGGVAIPRDLEEAAPDMRFGATSPDTSRTWNKIELLLFEWRRECPGAVFFGQGTPADIRGWNASWVTAASD